MAAGVPPPPLNSPAGSYYWLEWYTNLTNFLNGTNIPWSNLNFTNSNIADIQNRFHNSLTHIQGGNASGTATPTGNAYHLLGYGSADSAATPIVMPSGWTIVHTTTGTYTVTHNLGVATMAGGATINSSGAGYATIALSTNSCIIFTFGTTGVLADQSFSFWIGTV